MKPASEQPQARHTWWHRLKWVGLAGILVLGTITLFLFWHGSPKVTMTMIASQSSPQGNQVTFILSNTGPHDILCFPDVLVVKQGNVLSKQKPRQAQCVVLQPGRPMRLTIPIPLEASQWELHYRCHEKAVGLRRFIERNRNRGLMWIPYRIIDGNAAVVDATGETPFNGPRYTVRAGNMTNAAKP